MSIFEESTFFKLKEVSNDALIKEVEPLLVDNETILSTYKGLRDGVIFTNKRIISIDVQGITGAKKAFTSMPYSRIQVYSVETSGTLELGSQLEIWFSGIGEVGFEFSCDANLTEICKCISEFVLK